MHNLHTEIAEQGKTISQICKAQGRTINPERRKTSFVGDGAGSFDGVFQLRCDHPFRRLSYCLVQRRDVINVYDDEGQTGQFHVLVTNVRYTSCVYNMFMYSYIYSMSYILLVTVFTRLFVADCVVSRTVTQVLYLWFGDYSFQLVYKHSEPVIHPEVTLCGWWDVKIQDLINYDYVGFVAEEEENEGGNKGEQQHNNYHSQQLERQNMWTFGFWLRKHGQN